MLVFALAVGLRLVHTVFLGLIVGEDINFYCNLQFYGETNPLKNIENEEHQKSVMQQIKTILTNIEQTKKRLVFEFEAKLKGKLKN